MKILKPDERFKLKIEFDNCGGDAEKELAFIEKNDLFGALPNIFEFADDEIANLEDGF